MKERRLLLASLITLLALWGLCVACGTVAFAWPAPTPVAPVRVAQLPATNTPAATETPTPPPSPTSIATRTPLPPTDTPVRPATSTPAATATPTATAARFTGLNQPALQALYESADFSFVPTERADGQPSWIGQGPNGAVVELVGPPDNLLSASVAIPANPDPALNLENSTELARLLQAVAPDWPGGRDWLADGIIRLDQQERVETIYGGLLISLTHPPGLGQIVLTIRPVGQLG